MKVSKTHVNVLIWIFVHLLTDVIFTDIEMSIVFFILLYKSAGIIFPLLILFAELVDLVDETFFVADIFARRRTVLSNHVFLVRPTFFTTMITFQSDLYFMFLSIIQKLWKIFSIFIIHLFIYIVLDLHITSSYSYHHFPINCLDQYLPLRPTWFHRLTWIHWWLPPLLAQYFHPLQLFIILTISVFLFLFLYELFDLSPHLFLEHFRIIFLLKYEFWIIKLFNYLVEILDLIFLLFVGFLLDQERYILMFFLMNLCNDLFLILDVHLLELFIRTDTIALLLVP